MLWTLLLPAVVATGAGLVGARLQHRVEPSLAAAGLAALCAVAVTGVAGAVTMVVLVFVGETSWLASQLAWCITVGADHRVPTMAGGASVGGLAAMVIAGSRRLRRLRASAADGSEQPVVVLATPDLVAFAVPGRPGHVVVSEGMLRSLDLDERRVLFAHEEAHLRNEHHRYIWLSEVATAALPILRPLRRAVRLSTERWADEEAARVVGDRRLVARAICRAALSQHDGEPAQALAMAEGEVPRRVEALLRRPDHARPSGRIGLAAGIAVLGTALAASALQLHHLVVLVVHLCTEL